MKSRGPIAWMANNSVAVNILLLVLLAGGALQLGQVKQEVFPEFSLDVVSVSVPYPGASPEEIESGILLVLEEALRGIDGVKKVSTTAVEGMGSAMAEVSLGFDTDKVLSDAKSSIDQIRSWPKEAEKATVKTITAKNEVISLVIYGDASEEQLRFYAEKARDDLLENGQITSIDILGIKNREISIEIPAQMLSAHKLSLQGLANSINQATSEIPAGLLKTDYQDLSLRTSDRMDYANQYENVVVKSLSTGEKLKLFDLGQVKDGFEESDAYSLYNGKPAVMLRTYRTGEQKPTKIAEEVKAFAKNFAKELPPHISLATWNDFSSYLEGRINLLRDNALLGLVLVFFALALFLELRLAFWVTLGIPTTFLGAFLFLPLLGVSVNMISLFAFIIVLGMVVDDAIVVGENIFEHRKAGDNPLKSSVKGTKEIGVPVIFSVLTSMAAFSPLLFVPGVMGKFFYFVPIIVCLVLLLSLVDSLFILPNHLAHSKNASEDQGFLRFFNAKQQVFSQKFTNFINQYYRPMAVIAVKNRYITLSIALSILVIAFGLVAGGRVPFAFMPKMDSDIVLLHAEYEPGAPIKQAENLQRKLLTAAEKTLSQLGGQDKAVGFFSQIGASITPAAPVPLGSESGSHLLDIMVYLVSSEQRDFTSDQFSDLWRKELGAVAGLKTLVFKSTTGPSTGKPVSLQLMHRQSEPLEQAAKKLSEHLENYAGLHSIENGINPGKDQIEFKLKDSAYALGLNTYELGTQIRSSFYGAEAKRLQRGRDEVKVVVRLPKNERTSLYDIDNFKVHTKAGQVHLAQVADISIGKTYSKIVRENGMKVLTVSADIAQKTNNANEIMSDLEKNFLPQLKEEFPGLSFARSGDQKEQADTMQNLLVGFLMAMLMIYALIAIPLKSYVQPFIVMSIIPFGLIGALIGHMLFGFELSVISIMGLVALSGIVVNDSLVFIHAINAYRSEGDVVEKVADVGARRFRPIFLTSITTFFGLMPMILETSMQARFLIPMAISIGFGVMFATIIVLFLVPSLYVIILDIKNLKFFFSKTKAISSDESFSNQT